MAAGSEQAGFWFEMKSSVRAPTNGMSHELGQMNPMYLPLTQFEGNIAHSNHEHGFKTYPGNGYEPDGSPAVFKNLKSYRNRNSGVFIHNSRNIAIAGGVFADNRIGIDVDRSPTCSVTNATIIGLSPEYRSLSTQASLPKHCVSQPSVLLVAVKIVLGHSYFISLFFPNKAVLVANSWIGTAHVLDRG